jgi:hypothetical protein
VKELKRKKNCSHKCGNIREEKDEKWVPLAHLAG